MANTCVPEHLSLHTVNPVDLVAFALCKQLLEKNEGMPVISKERISGFIPMLLDYKDETGKPYFCLPDFLYCTMPWGPSSAEVDVVISFYCSEKFAIDYDKIYLTKDGGNYCKQVVKDFFKKDPCVARELSKVIGFSIDDIISQFL